MHSKAQITQDLRNLGVEAGQVMMVLGAANDRTWLQTNPTAERAEILHHTTPFDPFTTPADPEVGTLAEILRTTTGTMVSNHPEGRFAALGPHAKTLLGAQPWDDYFGPGSPLDQLCQLDGKVLRLGADPDTTTLTHFAEYLTPLSGKRRVTRHCLVQGKTAPELRVVQALDDDGGIFDFENEDYFSAILRAYLAANHGSSGMVGHANAQLLNARSFTEFAAEWMEGNLC